MVIACNTAHLLLPELEMMSEHTFVSLVSATIDAVKSRGIQTIGLLASPTTIRAKLYQDELENIGIKVITPRKDDLDFVESTIREVIAGEDPAKHQIKLQHILRHMKLQGAQSIILGCTELSVVFSGVQDETLIDPMGIVTTKLLGDEND